MINFGGAGRKRNESGESDGENLVRMRSILSLKKSRKVLRREDASDVSGSDFEIIRLRIVLRILQSVRGVTYDSVRILNKNQDLTLEMRNLTKLQWDTSSDIYIAQVDYVHAWFGEFRN